MKNYMPGSLRGLTNSTSSGAENTAMTLMIGVKRSARFSVAKDRCEPLPSSDVVTLDDLALSTLLEIAARVDIE